MRKGHWISQSCPRFWISASRRVKTRSTGFRHRHPLAALLLTSSEPLTLVANTPVTPAAVQHPSVDRKSYFACFLADEPGYLVPERLLLERANQDQTRPLVMNSHSWFSWREQLPAAVAACYPLPEKFLGDTGMIWIDDPVTGKQTPFWAGPWFQSRIADLSPGELAPALSSHHRSVLLAAGVLMEPGKESRRGAEWNQLILHAAQKFRVNGFVPLTGLIHPFHIGSLRKYYRHLIRTGGMTLGDSGSPRRFVAYNESVARFFHRQLTRVVSAVAGVRVKPSFAYVGSYQSGADLSAHIDRLQCEYAITLLIDYTPEPVDQSPWPFYLETSKGTVAIWQGIGDALLYRGRELIHYRKQLAEGRTSTSIFFYYVDQRFVGSLA